MAVKHWTQNWVRDHLVYINHQLSSEIDGGYGYCQPSRKRNLDPNDYTM